VPRLRHGARRHCAFHEDEHALVVDVEEPLRLELQGATPGQRIQMFAPAFESTNDRPIRVQGRVVDLYVGRDQPCAGGFLESGAGCAELGQRSAHYLDVLLRHRPRSIPRRRGCASNGRGWTLPGLEETRSGAHAADQQLQPRVIRPRAPALVCDRIHHREQRQVCGPATARGALLGAADGHVFLPRLWVRKEGCASAVSVRFRTDSRLVPGRAPGNRRMTGRISNPGNRQVSLRHRRSVSRHKGGDHFRGLPLLVQSGTSELGLKPVDFERLPV
jgi:hypothetical protein